jgi:hypothetical protein
MTTKGYDWEYKVYIQSFLTSILNAGEQYFAHTLHNKLGYSISYDYAGNTSQEKIYIA